MRLKSFLLHLTMAILFLLWMIIPHYVVSNLCYVLLAALSVFAIVFYSKTKTWWDIKGPKDKGNRTVQTIELGLAAILFLCCIPIGIASIVSWKFTGSIAAVLATVIFGLSMHLYVNQEPNSSRQLGIDLCLYASLIAAGIPVLGAIYHLTLGVYPLARLIALCVSLGICIMAYITYQGPHRNSKYQAGWAAGCMLAVALTFTINQGFGAHSPELHSYTVLSRSAEKADCVLDTERTFSYDHCPTPQDCTARIYLYDGWFHVTYLTPSAR